MKSFRSPFLGLKRETRKLGCGQELYIKNNDNPSVSIWERIGEQKNLDCHLAGPVWAQFTSIACGQNEPEFAEHDAADSSDFLTSLIAHGAMHFF